MAEDANQYGEQLYSRMQSSGGLSKYQVDKVLALQRLDQEVSELGNKGLLGESTWPGICLILTMGRTTSVVKGARKRSTDN